MTTPPADRRECAPPELSPDMRALIVKHLAAALVAAWRRDHDANEDERALCTEESTDAEHAPKAATTRGEPHDEASR